MVPEGGMVLGEGPLGWEYVPGDGCIDPGGMVLGCGPSPPPPTVNRLTDASKNITFFTQVLPVDSELLETFHPAVLGAVHGHHRRDAHYTHPLRRARHAQLDLLVLIHNPIRHLQLQRLRPARSRRDLDGLRRCGGCCLSFCAVVGGDCTCDGVAIFRRVLDFLRLQIYHLDPAVQLHHLQMAGSHIMRQLDHVATVLHQA